MSRRYSWGWLGIGIVLLGFSSAPAISQSSSFGRGLSIGGVVRDDETHQPIKAVTLQLMSEAGSGASPSVVSGTNGQFLFNGMISGNYRILVNERGYEPASVPALLGGTPLTNLVVALHRSEKMAASAPGDAISAHELSIPDKARDDFDKGVKYLVAAKPDYQRALTYFEHAIKNFPDYYEAYTEIGIVQHHLGDPGAAEQALRKAIELSSGRYLDALSLLAEMLNDVGRFSESEQLSRNCATQDESSWRCDLELARALAGLKHSADAEAVANKAAQLNPNNAATFLVLGNIHIQQRKYQAVLQDFDAYLKLDPSGPQSDQVRAAEEQVRKALAKAQNSVPSPSKK